MKFLALPQSVKNISKHRIFKIIMAVLIVAILIGGGFFYRLFWFPRIVVSKYVNEAEPIYMYEKASFDEMEKLFAGWEKINLDNFDQNSQGVKGASDSINLSKQKLEAVDSYKETNSTNEKVAVYFQNNGEAIALMSNIVEYTGKILPAISGFEEIGNINDAGDLAQTKEFILKFKKTSEDSLATLKGTEPAPLLVDINKDYQDLLNLFIKTCDDLTAAIDGKKTKEIERIGNDSAAASDQILANLRQHISNFKEKSELAKKFQNAGTFEKEIEENFENLKKNYMR